MVKMKKILSIAFLSFLLLNSFSSKALSQTADQVLEKMIEACGGYKILDKIKDTVASGIMQLVPYGMKGSITVYQKEQKKTV